MALPRFIEEQAFEKGFESFFEGELAEAWSQLEQDRLKILKQSRFYLAGVLVLTAGFLFLSNESSMPVILSLFVLGLGYLGFHINRQFHLNKYSTLFKQKILPRFFRFFGNFDYVAESKDPLKNKILPIHSSARITDCLSGEHTGLKFTMQELELYEFNILFLFQIPHIVVFYVLTKKFLNTEFNLSRLAEAMCSKGMLLTVQFPRTFKGETLVLKDKLDRMKGILENFTSSQLSKVSLEDPQFEAWFTVYSTDQVEARYLLTTALMQRLIDLGESLKTKPLELPRLRVEFSENKMVLYLNTAYNFFEPYSLKNKLEEFKELHLFLQQMNQLFQFIDALKLNRL